MKSITRFPHNFSQISRRRFILPLSMACLFTTTGCGMATFDGESDLLQLKVVHPDDGIMSSLGALLAEGTQVEMRAHIKDGDQTASIKDVQSDDKSVIEVRDVNASRVVFAALKAGRTDVQLTVNGPDSEAIEDVIPLEVRTVASTVVTNTCKDSVVLTNGHVDMGYSMRDQADKRLTGYGFYPLSFEPAGPTVDQDYKFVQTVRVLTGPTHGTFSLKSTLPTSTLELEVIAPGDVTKLIDGNPNTDTDPTSLSLDAGPSPVTTFQLEADDKSVCGDSDHLEVHSQNPELCTAQLKPLANLYFLHVTPLAEGDCSLEVRLVDTDKTVLKTKKHTVSISP